MGLGSCCEVSPAFPPLSHHQARLSLGASKGAREEASGKSEPICVRKGGGKKEKREGGRERRKRTKGGRERTGQTPVALKPPRSLTSRDREWVGQAGGGVSLDTLCSRQICYHKYMSPLNPDTEGRKEENARNPARLRPTRIPRPHSQLREEVPASGPAVRKVAST